MGCQQWQHRKNYSGKTMQRGKPVLAVSKERRIESGWCDIVSGILSDYLQFNILMFYMPLYAPSWEDIVTFEDIDWTWFSRRWSLSGLCVRITFYQGICFFCASTKIMGQGAADSMWMGTQVQSSLGFRNNCPLHDGQNSDKIGYSQTSVLEHLPF